MSIPFFFFFFLGDPTPIVITTICFPAPTSSRGKKQRERIFKKSFDSASRMIAQVHRLSWFVFFYYFRVPDLHTADRTKHNTTAKP